jgi:hypothetical protein
MTLFFYNNLVADVRRLQHDSDKFEIPDPAEAGAWDVLYAEYQRRLDCIEKFRKRSLMLLPSIH